MKRFFSLVLSFFTALSLVFEGIPYAFEPTLKIDAAVSEGEVSSRASGFLYGLAENGVPDTALVESIDIASVSQKVIGGLQHPIGDVDHVAPALDSCEYITVYLQDCFDTWYYCHQEILDLRAAGEYDCVKFVAERFLPQVTEKVTLLKSKDYADRLVYCPYNEADNAVWFGTPSEDGTWLMFDDAAKFRFYEAWKTTYNLIRSIDPDAVIGGPGYCDYDVYELEHFLAYCKENNCLPDIMIYHELGEKSALYMQDHVEEYRELEAKLGLDKLPIIVTEYGTMYECGAPADMLKYIVGIEQSGVWANAAYWRLANNLCDTSADNNSPNSNWWLFRWYADMEGDLLSSKVIDPLHADFANVIKYGFDRFHYNKFNGMASVNEAKDEITILAGGCDYTGQLLIKNLDKTALGKNVRVKIEAVYYEGLSGIVNSPYTVAEYSDTVTCNNLKIKLENPDPTAVYRITVIPCKDKRADFFNTNLPVRYEFEHGVRSGGCYTYDSAYATTGELQGMVGGLENIGDSVTLNFSVEADGYYDLSLIFGNSNDGARPDDRCDSKALMTLDGEQTVLSFPNTIKSEYTDKHTLVRYLKAGEHSITLAHHKGTFVVDSMLVVPHSDSTSVALFYDSDRSDAGVYAYLVVAPRDGYYSVNTGKELSFTVDGAPAYTDGDSLVYLRKGLNYLEFESSEPVICQVDVSTDTGDTQMVSASEMTLDAGAVCIDNYIDGISSLGGEASFTVNVAESGTYRMTVAYSNNDEGGVHSYNVDLIERYVTVTTDSGEQTLWCRNTYSWDTVKTATINIELEQGENKITLSNNGSVTFNSKPSYAPHIYGVSVNAVCK